LTVEGKRVVLVADELRGLQGGGLGTATAFLAVAAARMGHRVEVLYVGSPPAEPLEPEWAQLYEGAGVTIRVLSRSKEMVEPAYFARLLDVVQALRADPPDVVITQDLAAPAYAALRLKQLGLDLEHTLFVVYCHGTRQWVTDMARKVRVLPGALAVSALERASIELADIAVSPSAYMVDWMRQQGWELPHRTTVIPLLTRSSATGEPPPPPVVTGERVERIAFFGRLEERKGLRPFTSGLNALSPELLEKVELEFFGSVTSAWSPERVEDLLSETARRSLRSISFETALDQPEVLSRLSRPGTLAVMPSLEDNSPSTVYECLERGIPFIVSGAGGASELIAPADRARVTFEPTPEGVEAALTRALSNGDVLHPARPAFDPAGSFQAWAEVIATRPVSAPLREPAVDVDVVVVHRESPRSLERCLAALEAQSHDRVRVIVEGSREAGLQAAAADWVVLLDEEDVPEDELVETLVRAQAASDADVVTCGLQLSGNDGQSQYFFVGEPRGLGLLSNGYGNTALIRRALLGDATTPSPAAGDPDWPLFARLSIAGARIVSVPAPLVTRPTRPGTLTRHPADALLVAEQFERALPDRLRSLARLAAGLAAETEPRSLTGANGFARRGLRRLLRGRR
jgi:glycosyltransferase involved in cell wall biosynthesis